MAGGDRPDLVEAGECDVLAPNPRIHQVLQNRVGRVRVDLRRQQEVPGAHALGYRHPARLAVVLEALADRGQRAGRTVDPEVQHLRRSPWG